MTSPLPTVDAPEVSLAYAARMVPEHDYDVLLQVQVEWAQRRLLVSGELDVATCGLLAEAIALLAGPAPAWPISVDLGGVRFIDAAGIGVLVAAAGRLKTCGQELRLVGCGGLARELMILTGAAQLLLSGESPQAS